MANTKQRSVRIDEELWELYGNVCVALGTTRAAHIVAHIEKTIEEHTTEGSTSA